jgi:hypothetical protein
MGKRIVTAKDLHIKSWNPSRIKTGWKNHPIGKKITVVLLPTPAEPRRESHGS